VTAIFRDSTPPSRRCLVRCRTGQAAHEPPLPGPRLWSGGYAQHRAAMTAIGQKIALTRIAIRLISQVRLSSAGGSFDDGAGVEPAGPVHHSPCKSMPVYRTNFGQAGL
jgi:hypothetical protein